MPEYPFSYELRNKIDELGGKNPLAIWFALINETRDYLRDPAILELQRAGYSVDSIKDSFSVFRLLSTNDLFELASTDLKNSQPVSPAILRLQVKQDSDIDQRAFKLTADSDPILRCLGIAILRRRANSLRAAVVKRLKNLSRKESDAQVIAEIALGLVDLKVEGRSKYLDRFIDHENKDVREAVAFALGLQDDVLAIAGLITLCNDPCEAVRNWAVFGLSWADNINPLINEALLKAMRDENPGIRCDAIVGLARRHDKRAEEVLIAELRDTNPKFFAVEAAMEYGDPVLIPHLIELKKRCREDKKQFVQEAIEACS